MATRRPYLGGDGASEQDGVAEVEGGGVGEDAQPVPAVRRHAEGAVPLVQGEEERGEVQRDEDAHPHGPVEGPHEGSDGGRRVFAADLGWGGNHALLDKMEDCETAQQTESLSAGRLLLLLQR